MPPREEPQSRKEQILKAAAGLFAERGYYRTTTADVAREVGVTQPYVFHFFKSKEELYLAVLDQASAQISQAFRSVEAPMNQLWEAMGSAFKQLIEHNRNEILLVMTAFTIPEPAVRAYTRHNFDQVFEQVKARFAQAGYPDAEEKASIFIGQGLTIALAETLDLRKLTPWC